MSYAVSCNFCGAKFTVGTALLEKKFTGKFVTVRCKSCHQAVKLDAGELRAKRHSRRPVPVRTAPSGPPSRPPAGGPPSQPSGLKAELPARPKPPPLRARPAASARTDAFDGLGPGLIGGQALDLSTEAESLPPSGVAQAMDAMAGASAEGSSTAKDASVGTPSLAARREAPKPPRRKDGPRPVPEPPTVPLADVPNLGAPTIDVSDAALRSATPARPAAPESRSFSGIVLLSLGVLAAGGLYLYQRTRPPQEAAPSTLAAPPPAAPESPPEEPRAAPPQPSPAEPSAAPAQADTGSSEGPEPAAPPSHESGPSAAVTQPAGQPEPGTASPGAVPPVAKPPTASPSPTPKQPEPTEERGPFNTAAAAAALKAAAAQASSCRNQDEPTGTASVTVTFANSGRVTTATISGPPFAGTKTGGCIAMKLRQARVPPFDGDLVRVSKTVVIR